MTLHDRATSVNHDPVKAARVLAGVQLDNNAVERTIRPIALNRKNALFAGHDAGAENWAVIASLIETCKLNGVDPYAWLATTLRAIVGGQRQNKVRELLPRNPTATV